MQNLPPLILIHTWLYFANTTSKDFNLAQKNAQRRLENLFGSVEIAQVFYNHQMTLLKKVKCEAA